MRKFSGHTEFKDSLGYMRPYLRKKKKVNEFNKEWLRPLIIIKIALMFISALTAYVMCTLHVPGACRGKKRALDALDLEVYVSCLTGKGMGTSALNH